MPGKLERHILSIFLILLLAKLTPFKLLGQTEIYLLDKSPSQLKVVEKLLLQEQYDSASVLLDDLLDNQSKIRTKGIAHLYQGQAADQDALAINSFNAAQLIFRKTKFNKGLAMALTKEGEIHFFLQDYEKADLLFSEAAPLAEKENSAQVAIDAWQYLAMMAIQQNEVEKVAQYLKRAVENTSLEEKPDLYRDLINQLATNYQASGRLDSSIYYFKELIRINQMQEDENALLGDYAALGNLYKERGDYEQAQIHLFAALKIAESSKDSFQIIPLFIDIGDVYLAQQLPESAEPHYQKALAIASVLKRDFAAANINLQLSKVYQKQKEQELSIRHAEIALQLYQELKNRSKIAETLLLLSELYKTQLDYKEAKLILEEALAVRDELEDKQGTLAIKKSLAALEIDHGDASQALSFARECLTLYQDMGDAKGLRDSYQLLSEAYSKLGAFDKAFAAQSQFMILNDSLISLETAVAISESNARYDLAQQEKTLAQAQERIQTQKVALLSRSNLILALSGGFILVVISTVFLFFTNHKNKQLNKQRIAVLEKEKESEALKAMIQGEEKERKRFAQELHDGLGAVLAGAKMSISKITNKSEDQSTQKAYQKASDLIDNASRSVREIAHNLMPYALDQQGLIFAIEDLCQNFRLHRRLEIDFIHYGEEAHLNDTLKITTFRICQELLTNSIKHAQATAIIVQLTIEAEELMLIIEDDGVGFKPQKIKSGIGLSNIQSRVNYLHGELNIDTEPDQGSTFTIVLPIA